MNVVPLAPAPALPDTERLAYSIEEAAQLLGVHYFSVYRMIQRGKLRACHVLRGNPSPETLASTCAYLSSTLRDLADGAHGAKPPLNAPMSHDPPVTNAILPVTGDPFTPRGHEVVSSIVWRGGDRELKA